MITIPELVAQALGSFLTSDTKNRFGSSTAHSRHIDVAEGMTASAVSAALPEPT
jgi:hypothetical protein